MADGSRGYRPALAMRQPTPERISSSPGTAGLPPFISFSTSCPKCGLKCGCLQTLAQSRLFLGA
jgi:hypothetical protein